MSIPNSKVPPEAPGRAQRRPGWPDKLARRAEKQLRRILYRLLDGPARARLGPALLAELARRPATAKPPVWPELAVIHGEIRRLRPRRVLEFGSGCSTVVIAQALAENAAEGHPGFLESLDADPHWGQVTIDSLPPRLAEHCRVAIVPAIPAEHAGIPAWRHREVPPPPFDFIYLDGPALTPEREAALDLLDLEAELAPGTVVLVDGRYPNCRFLEAHLRRRWRRRRRHLLHQTRYELLA